MTEAERSRRRRKQGGKFWRPVRLQSMDRSMFDDPASMVWHIWWQAVVGRDLICDARLARQIRTRLLGAHLAHGRELLYYLILPREIHLLSLLPKGDSAASLGNGLSNMIAKRVRQADGMLGAVFRDRYQSQRIDDKEGLLAAVRMLAWRPVAEGYSTVASNFPHAALRSILGLDLAEGLHAAALLESLGETVPLGRIALRQALTTRPSHLEVLQWELSKGLVPARGAVGTAGAFARRVSGPAAALVAASARRDIDGALQLLELWVATRLGLPAPFLADQRGFVAARARALVASLAVKFGLCPASYVAAYFGRAKATISEQMKSLRCRPADKAILATPADKLVREAVDLAAHQTDVGRIR